MPGSVNDHADIYAGVEFGIREPSLGDSYQAVT